MVGKEYANSREGAGEWQEGGEESTSFYFYLFILLPARLMKRIFGF